MTTPSDQDVRHRIRDEHAASLLVDAGAGTGKTTALVERITALIATGAATVDELAAITFTEAAATELRHRVRSELEQALAAAPDEDRLSVAVSGIDDAAFTTLHAFALGILRDHAVAAGLPPRLELLSPVEEEVELDRRWEGFLDRLFGERSFQQLIGRMHRMGVSPTGLREVAEKLHQDQDRVGELGEPPADLPEPDVERVRRAGEALFEVRRRCTDDADKLAVHLDETVRPWLAAIEGMHGEMLLGELLSPPDVRPSVRSGSKTAWPGCKDDVHAACEELEVALAAVRDEQAEALARVLAAHLARFVTDWAADRRRDGRLVFADLLVLARDLVRDDVDVRRAVRRRHRFVLVDEFQDTDPIQYELAVLLGTDPDGTPDELEPGRLFVVGDPKQSIYGFRRADIAIYDRARSRPDLETVDLVENFRSRPAVLDWVNAAFTRLVEPEPGSQPEYVPLQAYRDDHPDTDPRVGWFGGAHEEARAAEVRVHEAEQTAAVIRRLVDEGEDPGDVAILVRRHGTVRLLEQSLSRAGLPYRIESRSLIHQTDEVRGLTELLAAIADPDDEVAVVAALRHAALGCSDRDLVDHRHAGGRWRPNASLPEGVDADGAVARGLAWLAGWSERADALPLGQLVDELVRELGLRELAFAHRRPRDRWRRLAFVADQARVFHEAGGHLRGFVRHLHREAARGVRVDEHVVGEADDASIRITTVHGAKGLEYGTVVLLGLDQPLDRPPGNLRVAWGEDGAAPELSLHAGLRTGGFDERRAAYVRGFGHEEIRLLYVGATRARERLIVSRHHKAGTDCHAARLDAIADELEPYWTEVADAFLGSDQHASLPAEADPTQLHAAVDAERAFVAERRALLQRAARPSALAATTIAAELASTSGPDPEVEKGHADAVRLPAGRLGPAVGRAVHRALQELPLDTEPRGDAAARTAERTAQAEGVGDQAGLVAAMVGNVLTTATVRAAAAATRVHRELPIGVPVQRADGSTVALEGVIDLLFETEDGWVIVDHKTDDPTEVPGRELARRYQGQAAAYAVALRELLGEDARIARAVLVFARDGSEVRLDAASLDTLAPSLLEHVRR